VLIAKLLANIAADFPTLRALVLVHVRELLTQNLEHLLRVWPGVPCGINSAGLRRRDWQAPIVLANIQSVWRSPQRLGRRDLVIVDEAQLVPHDGDGMYRSLVDSLRELGVITEPHRMPVAHRAQRRLLGGKTVSDVGTQ
jgi:DNA repair protein RadD